MTTNAELHKKQQPLRYRRRRSANHANLLMQRLNPVLCLGIIGPSFVQLRPKRGRLAAQPQHFAPGIRELGGQLHSFSGQLSQLGHL